MNGSKPATSLADENTHGHAAPESGALDIWQFSADVSNRLMFWNSINIMVGVLLGRHAGVARGFASQNIGWGVINIAIAVFGKRAGKKRFAVLDDPYAPQVQARDARNLRLLLAANGGLDILYMLGGLRLMRGAQTGQRRGVGLGIMAQGLLLFIFDWRMFRRSFFIKRREAAAREAV